MPEIGEVARIVHYLKKHLVGRAIRQVHTQDDPIVYGKVGCSAEAFAKAMKGKTVVDVRQQGKYFWMVMSSPPHPLMHLGMTGWIKFSNDNTAYYRPVNDEEQTWPPKFWKFRLDVDGGQKCEVAFVDARRLGRIRLVDVEADQMRLTTPLKENGPDPVIDAEILTKEWLRKKLKSKKVPVKAMLLNQANISGVGNWVADEVLYQAKIHPEQYSNTFTDKQADQLHDSLIGVCTLACETLADSSQFPENWLMRHRWNKGKKESNTLPNGEKIVHITVGGRTSAVVPSVQKKTGPVAGDIPSGDESETKSTPKQKAKKETSAIKAAPKGAPKPKDVRRGGAKREEIDSEEDEGIDEVKPKPTPKKRKVTEGKAEVEKSVKKVKNRKDVEPEPGRRRSGRNSSK